MKFGFKNRRIAWALSLGVVLLLTPFLSAASSSQADASTLHWERFGREKGLTTDIVTAVCFDRSGLLWVGSRDGLRMYDGYSFQLFDHDISDPQSLSDNAIRTLFEDRQGRFWVGTNAGGLELMDRSTGKFRHFRHQSGDPTSISHDSVYAIVQDKDEILWVGTQDGLNRLDPKTLKFERVSIRAKTRDMAGDYVAALHVDRQGDLWIATVGSGLFWRNSKDGSITSFSFDPNNQSSINSDRVFAIAEEPSGMLWIGTDKGVARIEPDRGVTLSVTRSPNGSGLSNETITSLALASNGALWAGTLDGLNEIQLRGGVSQYKYEDKKSAGRADFMVTGLQIDRDGHLWIGTWGLGLIRAKRGPTPFGLISASPDGLDSRDVAAVLHDRSGRLWVGTLDGGLSRRDPNTTSFYHYDPNPYGGAVRSLCQSKDGSLWVGTYQGLERMDPATGGTKNFVHNPSDPGSLGAGYITAILQDSVQDLWIGTGGSGLQKLNKDGKSFTHFVNKASDDSSLSENYVTVLHETRDGKLLVGTRSGGLNECDRGMSRCIRYLPGSNDGISHHNVTSIYEDSADRLWIGTAGGGLNLLADRQAKGRFEHFTVREGLPDNNVMSIAEENDFLWLGTKHGLARFNPSTHEVVDFGIDDGIPNAEFNNSAVARDATYIYLGTTDGLLTIPRGVPPLSRVASPIAVTRIRALKGLTEESLSTSGAQVEIPYGTIVSFEAAVLDFADPSGHRYQYQLKGLRDEWIDLSSRRGMTFADLRPGTYTMTVKGRNAHGIWSTAPPIPLRVIPPFWMRNWFRLLVALILVGMVIGIHRYRTAALMKRNRQLVEAQMQRERALQEARQSEEALQSAYEKLQSLARRIEAVAEDERRRIAHELHDEMGQLLTAAKINLQLLPAPNDSEVRVKRMADTVDLVDNMISRVRALSLDLRPPLLYELGLFPALEAYAEGQARRSGIEIELDNSQGDRRFSNETEITVFRVVQEAVTNVIRHAGATRIQIRILLNDGKLEITIHDNGLGFDVRSVQSREASGEGHLGLIGIRQRVQLLGGDTSIRSNDGDGTTIAVSIPAALAEEAACG